MRWASEIGHDDPADPQPAIRPHCMVCNDSPDGLLLVGAVTAVEVLPITDDTKSICPNVPHLFVYPTSDGEPAELWGCGTNEAEWTLELAYHDPASLVGRYGVIVTDARRAAG